MAEGSPHSQYEICSDEDVDTLSELRCAICHRLWSEPVELCVCHHIFCRSCLDGCQVPSPTSSSVRPPDEDSSPAPDEQPIASSSSPPLTCPECNTVSSSSKRPHRVLVQACERVQVKCVDCSWRGSIEQWHSHHRAGANEVDVTNKGVGVADTGATSPITASASGHSSPLPEAMTSLRKGVLRSFVSADGGDLCGDDDAKKVCSSTDSTVTASSQLRLPRPSAELTDEELQKHFGPLSEDDVEGEMDAMDSRMRQVSGVNASAIASSLNSTRNVHLPQIASDAWTLSASLREYGTDDHSNRGDNTSSVRRYGRADDSGVDDTPKPWRTYNLSQMEYEQAMGIFFMFCSGGTSDLTQSSLTFIEFHYLAVFLNYTRREEDSASLFRAIDRRGNRSISFDDYCFWLQHNVPSKDDLLGLTRYQYNAGIIQFREADSDNRCMINFDQFKTLCRRGKLANSEASALRLFERCDREKTGYVSLLNYLFLLHQLDVEKKATKAEYSSPLTVCHQESFPEHPSSDRVSEAAVPSPPQPTSGRGPPQPPRPPPREQYLTVSSARDKTERLANSTPDPLSTFQSEEAINNQQARRHSGPADVLERASSDPRHKKRRKRRQPHSPGPATDGHDNGTTHEDELSSVTVDVTHDNSSPTIGRPKDLSSSVPGGISVQHLGSSAKSPSGSQRTGKHRAKKEPACVVM